MVKVTYISKVEAFHISYVSGVLSTVKVIGEDRIAHDFLKQHLELYEEDLDKSLFNHHLTSNKMKLKLSRVDLQIMISHLQQVDQLRFDTDFESKICRSVTLQILQKLVKKLADMKEESSLKIEPHQIVVLRTVLTRLSVEDEYASAVINELIMQTDQLCLSI